MGSFGNSGFGFDGGESAILKRQRGWAWVRWVGNGLENGFVCEAVDSWQWVGTGVIAATSRRNPEWMIAGVIMYSSTYTGGVARLVAQMRSAKIENRVFGEITRKKILFLWIFLILRAARLVARRGGWSGSGRVVDAEG
jgi:hypothetical protein